MRITVFGATGGIGRHVVDQALGAGHEVRALVREEGRLAGSERLSVVVGDIADGDAFCPDGRGQRRRRAGRLEATSVAYPDPSTQAELSAVWEGLGGVDRWDARPTSVPAMRRARAAAAGGWWPAG